MANKIKYGIRNCYYAVATDTDGVLTYGTPKRLAGAVSLSLEAQGESNPFYADDIVYFQSIANNGYSGSLELALIPSDFKGDVLGELTATNGLLVEKADTATVEFALLFEFQGDQSATRHALYRCIASRPAVSGQTKEANVTPQTETINLTVLPRIDDHLVKGRCNSTASEFANWFSAVVEP
jgi:phi13 family phage major tail protein